MNRRDALALLGGAATWPLAARSQQMPSRPIIGFLDPATPEVARDRIAAFEQLLTVHSRSSIRASKNNVAVAEHAMLSFTVVLKLREPGSDCNDTCRFLDRWGTSPGRLPEKLLALATEVIE